MNREGAKFVVENIEQISQLINRGGEDTYLVVPAHRLPDINKLILSRYLSNLKVMTAFANGAEIQVKQFGAWISTDCPLFTDIEEVYRVKPELREFYIVKSKSSGVVHDVYDVGVSFPVDKNKYEYIKVRELP